MWHLQVSAVPLPAELAWSQLELFHLDQPQLKQPFWDWSRVRGTTEHNTNISLNTNLMSFGRAAAAVKDGRTDLCDTHLTVLKSVAVKRQLGSKK